MSELPPVNNREVVVDNTASYGKRFTAFMIDSLLIALSMAILLQYLGFTPDQSPSVDFQVMLKSLEVKLSAMTEQQQLLLFVFPYLIFFIFHGYLLFNYGQTIGKRFVGIAIVTIDDQKPSFAALIFNRYLTQWVIGMIPMIGMMLRIADISIIFKNDKRCVHDLIAKTKVVDLKIQPAKNTNSIMA